MAQAKYKVILILAISDRSVALYYWLNVLQWREGLCFIYFQLYSINSSVFKDWLVERYGAIGLWLWLQKAI